MTTDDLKLPTIVSQDERQVAREELLAKEKKMTRALDVLPAERRRLPMVEWNSELIKENVAEEIRQRKNQLGKNMALFAGADIASTFIKHNSVDDIDTAMDALKEKGVQFEHYGNDKLSQDDKRVLRGQSAGMGPDVAWFKDPAGNVLSILEE